MINDRLYKGYQGYFVDKNNRHLNLNFLPFFFGERIYIFVLGHICIWIVLPWSILPKIFCHMITSIMIIRHDLFENCSRLICFIMWHTFSFERLSSKIAPFDKIQKSSRHKLNVLTWIKDRWCNRYRITFKSTPCCLLHFRKKWWLRI